MQKVTYSMFSLLLFVFTAVSLLPLLPVFCVSPGVKEYVTVGQLSQMYGMPKVESSPTSPLRQPLPSGAVDPAFSCLPSPHGSSLSLSVEVCGVFLPSSLPSLLPSLFCSIWLPAVFHNLHKQHTKISVWYLFFTCFFHFSSVIALRTKHSGCVLRLISLKFKLRLTSNKNTAHNLI